jgi:diacylglycerol kinase family enzyme
MRAAVIVNPAKADVTDLREQVESTLAAAGWTTTLWLETTPEDPGPGVAQAAVDAGVQLVVICGGDGTLLACLHALVGSGLPVALIPLGTGNLLARNLGVSTKLDEALSVAVDGVDRRIDCGRVDGQPFAVMAGIGFDAAMMAEATEGMKRFAGWPAYVAGGLRHLRDPMMRVRLRIDDGPPIRRRARTVLIGNVGRLQGGVELLLDAKADDGLLDVVVVAPRTLRDWILLGWRVIRRHRTPHPHLERFRGRSVLVDADRIVPRQMDGEVIDDGRNLNARIEPGALVIRAPQRAATAA